MDRTQKDAREDCDGRRVVGNEKPVSGSAGGNRVIGSTAVARSARLAIPIGMVISRRTGLRVSRAMAGWLLTTTIPHIIRWSCKADSVGPASPGIFRWLRPLDL
jgi:hypothetical protein